MRFIENLAIILLAFGCIAVGIGIIVGTAQLVFVLTGSTAASIVALFAAIAIVLAAFLSMVENAF